MLRCQNVGVEFYGRNSPSVYVGVDCGGIRSPWAKAKYCWYPHLLVREGESRLPTLCAVAEAKTEDVYHILPIRITSIEGSRFVQTRYRPEGFAASVHVDKILALGSYSIPPRFQPLAIQSNIALTTRSFSTLYLECKDLNTVGTCSGKDDDMSTLPDIQGWPQHC